MHILSALLSSCFCRRFDFCEIFIGDGAPRIRTIDSGSGITSPRGKGMENRETHTFDVHRVAHRAVGAQNPTLDTGGSVTLRVKSYGGRRYLTCESGDNEDSARLCAEHLSSLLKVIVGGLTKRLDDPLPSIRRDQPAVEASLHLAGVPLATITITADNVDVKCVRQLTAFDTRQLTRLTESGEPSSRYLHDFARVRDLAALPPRKIDLHTHFAGELSAARLIALGIEHNSALTEKQLTSWNLPISVNITHWTENSRGERSIGLKDYLTAIDETSGPRRALDVKEHIEHRLRIPATRVVPFRELSKLYDEREFICQDPRIFSALLREIALQYKELGVQYAELSLSAITNATLLKIAHDQLPAIEAETGVRMRFLAGLRRTESPENLQQLVDIVKVVASRSPYVVGVDFMGHEVNSTRAFSAALKSIAAFKENQRPDFQIRVHAGENARYAENVIAAIELGATRIGHGLRGVDDRVFQKAKQRGVIMELNLSSNATLNNLIGVNLSEEVIISRYLTNGVRVTLGSDGSGVYQGGGKLESYAALMCGLTEDQLSEIDRSDARYIEDQQLAEEAFRRTVASHGEVDDAWFASIPPFRATSSRVAQAEHTKSLVESLGEHGVELITSGASSPERGLSENLTQFIRNRQVIGFSGASKTFNELAPETQEQVDFFLRDLFTTLRVDGDPSRFVFMTGGTDVGVEKLVHKYARANGIDVLGAISDSTTGAIEPNTITHAFLAGRSWHDVLPAQIDLAHQTGGAIIFIGGGDIVKDAIQAAHNSGTRFALLAGVPGASGDKTALYPSSAITTASEALGFLATLDMNNQARTQTLVPGHFGSTNSNTSFINIFSKDARETMKLLRQSDALYQHLCSLPNDAHGNITVGEHTESVMNQLLRYPFASSLTIADIEMLKGIIACHDLEKYPERGERDVANTALEHQRAVTWLRHFSLRFGLFDERVEIGVAIINSDALGNFMKLVAPGRPTEEKKRETEAQIRELPESERGEAYRRSIRALYEEAARSVVSSDERRNLVEATAKALSAEATSCGLSVAQYFRYAIAFYQSDCSTYTADSACESTRGRGRVSMEFLFEQRADATLESATPTLVFDSGRQRLRMRGVFEDALQELEGVIFET